MLKLITIATVFFATIILTSPAHSASLQGESFVFDHVNVVPAVPLVAV